jgi:nucleoside 2-deoxyribosyltransferase
MKRVFLSHGFPDAKADEIATALDEAGFAVATPFTAPFDIGKDVATSLFEQLKQASVVVAVLADQKPNVLLELGYALGMAKPVILIANVTSNLPFDLAGIEAIDYKTPVREIVSKILRSIEKLYRENRLEEAEFPHDLRGMMRIRLEFPEQFERIPYWAFERAISDAFRAAGYETEQADLKTDYGFDFKLKHPDGDLLVEVKKLSPNGRVSIAAVQQLLGAIHAYEAPQALLICTSDFTDSARGFAGRHARELTLWTASELNRFAEGQLRLDEALSHTVAAR